MRLLSLLGCALLALAGCGSSDSRVGVAVAGTVTNGAAPLASGVIRFTPETGTPVAATVAAGKYSAQLPPGKYKVTIEATSGSMPGGGSSDDRTKAAKLPTIPEKYRTTGVPTDIAAANPALDFDLSK